MPSYLLTYLPTQPRTITFALLYYNFFPHYKPSYVGSRGEHVFTEWAAYAASPMRK